jgi:excisionase family DNA binding protein
MYTPFKNSIAEEAIEVNTRGRQMHKKQEPAFLTADEGHKIVGKDKISRRSFYNALNRGQIPHVRVGRRILLPRVAFMAWLQGDSAGAIPRGGHAA